MRDAHVSDETLAAQAAQGDDVAMAALIERIMPLAKAKALAFHTVAISQEDLQQEGMLGFLNALRTFQVSCEVSFRTYAAVCIQNRIVSAVRSQLSGKNSALNTHLPLDEDLLPVQTSPLDPQDLLSDKEDAARLLAFLQSALSELERRVVALFLQGESYEVIASQLQISQKSVDNALQRVRNKLKRIQ